MSFKTPSKLTIPIGEVGDDATPRTSPASPRTPTTPITRAESLEFLYGTPIDNFIPGRKPTKIEVVQFYMYYYDQVSES